MTINLSLGKIFGCLFFLLFFGSWPANWWMMKHNVGCYAGGEKWQAFVCNEVKRYAKDGNTINHYELKEIIADAPCASNRTWCLIFSPVTAPVAAVHWLADSTIDVKPEITS